MSMPSRRSKQPRSGRRKLVMVLFGLVSIGAGLFVFRYSAEIANQVSGYIGTPPDTGSNVTGLAGPQAWYLPYAVWGFGFTLIGAGGTMLRSALMSSMMGSGMGGMGGGAGMSPEMMEGYMQQSLAATRQMNAQTVAGPAAAKEIVKVKCRSCGNLEPEDAAFCRKCGKPL